MTRNDELRSLVPLCKLPADPVDASTMTFSTWALKHSASPSPRALSALALRTSGRDREGFGPKQQPFKQPRCAAVLILKLSSCVSFRFSLPDPVLCF